MWKNKFGGLKVCMRRMDLERDVDGRLLEFCVKKSSVWQTYGFKRKISNSADRCGTETDLVFVGNKNRKLVGDAKVISWKQWHRLMIINLDNKVLKK